MKWLLYPVAWAASLGIGLLLGRALSWHPDAEKTQAPEPLRQVARPAPPIIADEFKQQMLVHLKETEEGQLTTQAAVTLRRWAERDFEGALAFAKSLKTARASAIGTVLAARASSDMEGTWRQVRELMKAHGSGVFYAFFHEWARTDRAAAVRFADAHPEVDDHYLGGRALLDLDGLHPAALSPLIASVKRDAFRQSLINHMVRHWPENDLAGMIAFLNTMPTPQQRPLNGSFSGSDAFHAWVRDDSLAVAGTIATLRSDMIRGDAWRSLTRTVLDDTSYAGVRALLNSAHAPAFMSALTGALGTGPSRANVEALLRLLPESTAKHEVIAALAQSAAEDFDISRAEALLNQLPEGQGGEVYARLSQHWFRADPVSAAAWMHSLTAGSAEQSWAQAGAVSRFAPDDLEQAMTLAETIRDPEARRAAVTSIARIIGRLSTPTRQAWLEQRTELTPIERMEALSGGR